MIDDKIGSDVSEEIKKESLIFSTYSNGICEKYNTFLFGTRNFPCYKLRFKLPFGVPTYSHFQR